MYSCHISDNQQALKALISEIKISTYNYQFLQECFCCLSMMVARTCHVSPRPAPLNWKYGRLHWTGPFFTISNDVWNDHSPGAWGRKSELITVMTDNRHDAHIRSNFLSPSVSLLKCGFGVIFKAEPSRHSNYRRINWNPLHTDNQY